MAEQRAAILAIAARHGTHDLRLFGSVARGDAAESSDFDLLVRFDPGRSLLDHAALTIDLEDLLEVRVDVIDADGMRPLPIGRRKTRAYRSEARRLIFSHAAAR